MKRKYLKYKAVELKEVAKNNLEDIEILEEILHELSFRKTRIAKELESEINKQIERIEKGEIEITPSIKTLEQGTLTDWLSSPASDDDVLDDQEETEGLHEDKVQIIVEKKNEFKDELHSLKQKIEEEKEKLYIDIEGDKKLLMHAKEKGKIPTWQGLCALLAFFVGLVGLNALIFDKVLHEHDFYMYLSMFVIGGGFSVYVFYKEIKNKRFIEQTENEIKQKEEAFFMLNRLK